MKILFFSSKLYDKESFEKCNQNYNFGIEYTSSQLNEQSVILATGYDAICTFVNDHLNENAARQGEAKPRWSSPQKGCLSAPLRDCA